MPMELMENKASAAIAGDLRRYAVHLRKPRKRA